MPVSLTDSVQFLKAVGPARVTALAKLGINTAGDLLFYFPRDLAHLPGVEPIAACLKRVGQVVTMSGVVERVRWGGWARPIVSAVVADGTAFVEVVWFNASWLRDRLTRGERIVITGKLRRGRSGPQLANPRFRILNGQPGGDDQGGDWEPVYPASAEISSAQIQRIVQANLPRLLPQVDEFVGEPIRRKLDLLDRRQAVAWLHFPSARPGAIDPNRPLPLEKDLPVETIGKRARLARRRLAFDEAFLFQLVMAMRRRSRQAAQSADPLVCDERVRQRILRRFPFPLTGAQQRATEQVAADLAKPVPMNRLLQGDVGSGKTVVALFAALVAVANKRQAAIMAPTEILARQHFARISQYLASSRVRLAALTGSLTTADRNRVRTGLADGSLDLVVGTTALISEGVRFARLGVAVIDEQHKFGVSQRAELKNPTIETALEPLDEMSSQAASGSSRTRRNRVVTCPRSSARGSGMQSMPHTLVMTATPIPRSLALTVFGDLAVSVLDELPPGRGTIETRIVTPANHDAAIGFVAARVQSGGQAFFVCPRIGEEDDAGTRGRGDAGRKTDADTPLRDDVESSDSVVAAEQAFRELRPRFARFGIDLVHGRMKRSEQDRIVADFAAGKVRVLVATTVIEVGVDIPRANVMAVLSAERFGLAQLHQLRGRVGRGTDGGASHCLLFVANDESASRLAILEQTRDGFRIAEEDLARRGPGQFFGLAQHGLPEFRVLDLARDLGLLRQARQEAFDLVAADPHLADPKLADLRARLLEQYGRSISLIDAG